MAQTRLVAIGSTTWQRVAYHSSDRLIGVLLTRYNVVCCGHCIGDTKMLFAETEASVFQGCRLCLPLGGRYNVGLGTLCACLCACIDSMLQGCYRPSDCKYRSTYSDQCAVQNHI